MHSQLPTPDSSISPEPLSTPTSPVVETSWGKPAVKEEFEDELESEDELEPGKCRIPCRTLSNMLLTRACCCRGQDRTGTAN